MRKADKLGRSRSFGAAPASARSATFARATGTGSEGLQQIPLDDIADNPENPRGAIDTSHPKFVGLANSISVIGLTSPIAVCRTAAFLEHHPQYQAAIGTRRYVLLAGHRRVTAARQAGLTEVPGTVDDSGAEDPLIWALAENGNHDNLDPIQQARTLAKLTDPAPGGKGLSQRNVAKAIGKTQPYISQMKVLLNLLPELQQKVSDGTLSQPDARPIARLDHAAQLQAYEELARRAAKKVPSEDLSPPADPVTPGAEEPAGDNSVITPLPRQSAPQPGPPAEADAPQPQVITGLQTPNSEPSAQPITDDAPDEAISSPMPEPRVEAGPATTSESVKVAAGSQPRLKPGAPGQEHRCWINPEDPEQVVKLLAGHLDRAALTKVAELLMRAGAHSV